MIDKQTIDYVSGQLGFGWLAIPAGDVGQSAVHGGTGDRTVQVAGTLGGATVTLEGSLDGVEYHTLHDTFGVELSFTTPALRALLENTVHIRPRVTGGDGTTSVNVQLAVRR